eukprot:gene6348-16266_t
MRKYLVVAFVLVVVFIVFSSTDLFTYGGDNPYQTLPTTSG